MDCRTFNDWGALRSRLIKAYELEDALIRLRSDFVNSESIDRFDGIEIREISEEEVLLSMSVGLRVCLDVHLFKKPVSGEVRSNWQPREDYRAILMCAKSVFSRTVRDRVVDLMSTRGRIGVVSFFLDAEGRVESASNKARDFCDTYFPTSKRKDDYLPQSHWDYLQGAIQLREKTSKLTYRNESLVFCFYQEKGTIDCLLQKMGGNGFLLSLAVSQ